LYCLQFEHQHVPESAKNFMSVMAGGQTTRHYRVISERLSEALALPQ
jgi:hypothetical protein